MMSKNITVTFSLTLFFLLGTLLLSACGPGGQAPVKESKLEITSPAFKQGEAIPIRYTCEGENISPELNWSGVPQGTRSFVLILHDPDAPISTFTHWVIYNIPTDSRGLPKAVPGDMQLADGTLQGNNSFGTTGYGGPCPPLGPTHRYRFTIYALDKVLDLPAGVHKSQMLRTINAKDGGILAQGQLTGIFGR